MLAGWGWTCVSWSVGALWQAYEDSGADLLILVKAVIWNRICEAAAVQIDLVSFWVPVIGHITIRVLTITGCLRIVLTVWISQNLNWLERRDLIVRTIDRDFVIARSVKGCIAMTFFTYERLSVAVQTPGNYQTILLQKRRFQTYVLSLTSENRRNIHLIWRRDSRSGSLRKIYLV